MSHILLLAATTGYQTRGMAEAARQLNVTFTLATDRCHILEDPWADSAVAVRFENPHASLASLAIAARSLGINAIAAVGDRPTLLAALTAEQLGLAWHPPAAALTCRGKHRMRAKFAAAGLLVPVHSQISLDEPFPAIPAGIEFPCVLKPLGLSASRGVIRADNPAQFTEAFERVCRILCQPEIQMLGEETSEAIQIEQFIPGSEYALEGLMTRGELRTLAIFDKPDPLDGPFFEESIYVTPSRASAAVQNSILETTARAVRALGLWHGPVHAEMRVNERGVYMLEIAARPIGGLCSRALQFQSGANRYSLEQIIVLHAIGEMPEKLRPASPASGVMMIPTPRAGIFSSVSGVEAARAVPAIEDVVITLKPCEKLTPLPEGAKYPGFIFASGTDPGLVIEALRTAHAELRFDVLAALPVIL